VVGIVYAKERLLAGHPTGIVYADCILGMNIVAEPGHGAGVFSVAIRCLLASGGTRALRLLVPRDGFEYNTILSIASSLSLEMVAIRSEKHNRLALATSYEDFLNSLHHRTRRNFRYYRRRFEGMGRRYIGKMTFETFRSAVWQLRERSKVGQHGDSIDRALKMLSAVDEPVLVGLQTSDGEWLAVAGGWCENGTATLLVQINNDREHSRDSLSQVLRSYLIEQLIAARIYELIFWAGTSFPLARYAQPVPAIAIYLDSQRVGWRLFRRLVSLVAPRLPRQLMRWGIWIAPLRQYANFD
jgi:hypothetical protein